MGHVSTGIRRILEHPYVYELFQTTVGHKNSRRIVVEEYLRPQKKSSILDLGCGPGKVLDVLPDLQYVGVDFNENYIENAKNCYPGKGEFYVGNAASIEIPGERKFDSVLAYNLMHHMEDEEVSELLAVARSFLREGGRFVSMDPCLVSDATFFASILMKYDRGKNIRSPEDYSVLAREHFGNVSTNVRYDLINFTYPHCILLCNL